MNINPDELHEFSELFEKEVLSCLLKHEREDFDNGLSLLGLSLDDYLNTFHQLLVFKPQKFSLDLSQLTQNPTIQSLANNEIIEAEENKEILTRFTNVSIKLWYITLCKLKDQNDYEGALMITNSSIEMFERIKERFFDENLELNNITIDDYINKFKAEKAKIENEQNEELLSINNKNIQSENNNDIFLNTLYNILLQEGAIEITDKFNCIFSLKCQCNKHIIWNWNIPESLYLLYRINNNSTIIYGRYIDKVALQIFNYKNIKNENSVRISFNRLRKTINENRLNEHANKKFKNIDKILSLLNI